MEGRRFAEIQRKTSETEIQIAINLDGTGDYSINTGIPFFNHLLELFAKHGRFDLTLHAEGDTEVDFHHLVEDTGIVMGQAFAQALGDKRGIRRFATTHVPMDEALVRLCIDLSGRTYLSYQVEIAEPLILHFNAQLAEEFFRAFAQSGKATIHIDLLRGNNAHHIVEALFKAFGVSLSQAVTVLLPEGDIPSTKGVL
jgi:imidazoleglycerol-phosphate dehydratase